MFGEYINLFLKRVRLQRLKEIENDGRICFPNDEQQEKFLKDETKLCQKSGVFFSYFKNIWYRFKFLKLIMFELLIILKLYFVGIGMT